MPRHLIASVILSAMCAGASAASEPLSSDLQETFTSKVRPYLETYCLDCHNQEKQKGDLDLSPYRSLDSVVKDFSVWDNVLQNIQEGDMPPEKAKVHPEREVSREVTGWIQTLRKEEAKRNAGDPGIVLARRLSNAEYNNTIRDLIGFDIRPAREFPVDPANTSGFDNSGESLAMSPGLFAKYLAAAREAADHLVLQPEGFSFAPHAVVTETDRDKYAVNRIVDFYRRQKTDYADYFLAAWTFKHHGALGRPNASLEELADERKLSRKYLSTVWKTLSGAHEELGPIAALQALWNDLPSPTAQQQPEGVTTGCEEMRDFVVQLRRKLVPEVKNLTAPRIHNGSQSFVLWKNRQQAANRTRYSGGATEIKPENLPGGARITQALTLPTDQAALQQYESAFGRFCSTFPDTFFVQERARPYLDPKQEKQLEGGRLLSAGFHSMMGYFRDDGPLYELMLNPEQQRELDRLWQELDFITSAPMRQHTGFVWFERTDSRFMRSQEFDFARAEDKEVTSEPMIRKLAEVYLAKAKNEGASDLAIEVIADFFQRVSANIRAVENARVAAEPTHLKALLAFARRAARRPLSAAENEDLLNFYRTLREKDQLSHEEAMRDTVASILMSPDFCYRVDLVDTGEGVHPLSDYALASRLSYFLWSSMPDEALLARAEAGELHRPEVLAAEARRMMRDERIRGFALEFGGNWLDVRRFEEHNSVNRERFPSFDNDLRQAMFEEPIRFLIDVVREDRSILDFLYGQHTFVNSVLAKHYGVSPEQFAGNEWKRVDDMQRYGRGGLLPMAVFLTKNAPGDRTSPVKRGHWVIKNLLGERVPPPPPAVPELAKDESKLGDLTLRQALEKHRADKNCAACHERIDSIGLVFEGFGPVGELRTKDLAGHDVDTHATFPGGSEGTGVDGLRTYIRAHRQTDFIDNLSRKLLAYALGRSPIISDDTLIGEMESRLKNGEYRFSKLLEAIITSPQFLNKRSQNNFVQN
ncbi:DUF1592 domain-containing protein [Verrucomicrobiota bacterium sgz303538]